MIEHLDSPSRPAAQPPWRLRHATSWDALQPRADEWNQLAHYVPFRTFDWLSAWWRHYGRPISGSAHSLSIVVATDDRDRLVGLAPWYLERSVSQGTVLRFLGSGDVCSDYLSLLCAPQDEQRFTLELANYLHPQRTAGPLPAWDLIDLTGVDAEDSPLRYLTKHLAESGCTPCLRAAPACWRLELSEHWDDYLARLSKSHRKQLRRTERRVLEPGHCRLHVVRQPTDLRRGIDLLIDFQRRRRHRQHMPTPFNDPRYVAFLHDAGARLLQTGSLWMHWIELAGRPAAVELYLIGGRVLYAYQGGIEPELLEESPGRLSHLLTIRRAMEEGFSAIDFLRGDEPYKQHWRASARPNIALRIVPPNVTARMRHGAWWAGESVKQWIKLGLGLPIPQPPTSLSSTGFQEY